MMNEIEKQILLNQLIIMRMLQNMDKYIYKCTKEIKQTEILIREGYAPNEKES